MSKGTFCHHAAHTIVGISMNFSQAFFCIKGELSNSLTLFLIAEKHSIQQTGLYINSECVGNRLPISLYINQSLNELKWVNKHITITSPCHEESLINPTLCSERWGLQSIQFFSFLRIAQNRYCGFSFELPYRGNSNEYSQFMFWAIIRKLQPIFIWKRIFKAPWQKPTFCMSLLM